MFEDEIWSVNHKAIQYNMPIDSTYTTLPLNVWRGERARVFLWTSVVDEDWDIPSLYPCRSWKHHVHVAMRTDLSDMSVDQFAQCCWSGGGIVYIDPQIKLCFHQSAASSFSELDHQTCRGSSIGRACGSYLLRYSKPQGRGFEPLLRLFLHTSCWRLLFALRRDTGSKTKFFFSFASAKISWSLGSAGG
jgi:hypothetical protein